jgi:hypothetical protein
VNLFRGGSFSLPTGVSNSRLHASTATPTRAKLNSPEGSGDTVLPGDVRGLEEGGGPGPLRDDDGRGKAGLDHSSGS